jgi:murein endopeptidase
MRLFVAVLALFLTATAVDARPRKQKREPREPDVAFHDEAGFDRARARARATKKHIETGRPQSTGLPWNGHLINGTQLHMGDGVYIRRPYRAWGTRTTVEFTKWAIEETLERHPNAHTLLIGDISQHGGGRISDHSSHQSGRDVDIGLFYKKAPPGHPNNLLVGTEANLDAPTMWTLVDKLTSTANKDGGVWAIFLDYEVQGIIYRYAKSRGVSETKLRRIFQYPHGRYAGAGLVRHYRNHGHHLHVRYKCTKAETNCR